MIPTSIKIKDGELPEAPGVYYMKDAAGHVMYVGKAVSLARRVAQYWTRPHGAHIEAMVPSIHAVDWRLTPTVIEALILESNEIRRLQPPVNVLGKDDASFLHVAITNEPFPKPVLVRHHDLEAAPPKSYKKVFCPYTSAAAVRAALELTRKIFHWSDCEPGQDKPCFYHHIKLCPGVCVGKISRRDYAKIIRNVTLFFEGKKEKILKEAERGMKSAAKREDYEEAARLRDLTFALNHIQDVAVIARDRDGGPEDLTINVFGRVEAFDISNIGGAEPVGSGVVFVEGVPRKSLYKKFRIKTVTGANDIAMMKEMIGRRFAHVLKDETGDWALPDLVVIDGGRGQVDAACRVLKGLNLKIPVVGLAKGPDRKQDVLVYGERTPDLVRTATRYKRILQYARDEAHRFAVSYHRLRRAKKFLVKDRL